MATASPINIALQGGGAHSAFAWGALDYLLQQPQIAIEAISATGGGAITAVVLAQGLLEDGREGARTKLEQLWRKVSFAAGLLPLKPKLADKWLGQVGLDLNATSLALDTITRIFSPYQFNLFDINPLRSIVDELVDFSQLRKHSPIKLFVNATHVPSGKARIFTQEELSLEAVMAAACLPYVFRTVMVDDAPYWDGSYTANPALTPLVEQCKSQDIVIIQTMPGEVDEVPTGATDILDRAAEIGFASSLTQELRLVRFYNRMVADGRLDAKAAYIHRIEAQDLLGGLGRASKLNADWDFLTHLHNVGSQAAEDWLLQYRHKLGRESSFDIDSL